MIALLLALAPPPREPGVASSAQAGAAAAPAHHAAIAKIARLFIMLPLLAVMAPISLFPQAGL